MRVLLLLALACCAAPRVGLLERLDAPLAADAAPDDLRPVPKRMRVRLERLREVAVASLTRMLDAARADGVRMWVSSGFRSYDRQREIFEERDAPDVTAPPGRSEHQLGTAVDLATGPTTVIHGGEAYAWMDAHAWEYGWINSYPPQDDASDDRTTRYTGYAVEPWHWRYVGDDAAAQAHAIYEDTGIRVSSDELIDRIRALSRS